MTLTEFLLARIAEDERDVHSAVRMREAWCWGDPERVLAECEAKRRIVDLHAAGRESYSLGTVCTTCADWEDADYDGPPEVAWPCPTLRLLGTVYADHADYRDEWKF